MLILVTAWTVCALRIWAPPFNKNKLTWTISCNQKALITFHHDAPNSYVPGVNFLEFLVNGLSTRSHGEFAKYNCMQKPYILLTLIWIPLIPQYLIWLLITVESKYNTNLKMYNIKVTWKACEVTLLLPSASLLFWRCIHSVARFKKKIYSKFFHFLVTIAKNR